MEALHTLSGPKVREDTWPIGQNLCGEDVWGQPLVNIKYRYRKNWGSSDISASFKTRALFYMHF